MKPYTYDRDRLAELEALGILDTPPEEGFDDVVHIARAICEAPVALVSLVAGDRQWFKARIGFPDCETDINASVCAHALTEPDLLVIPDLADDPRTRDNPLVTADPFIRFYAGAPLRSDSGRVLGSLCVIDHRPRPAGLSEPQADALRRLARQVMILLRERKQLAQMQIAERQARGAAARRLALIRLSDHLRDVSSSAEMAAAAAEIVGRTLEASRAGYGEIDEGGEFITVLQGWSAPGSQSLAGRFRLADYGEISPSLERGETLVVSAIAGDALTAAHSEPFERINVAAMLNVPVREGGRTVAMFYVHSAVPRHWAEEEITFARNVADRVQIGVARLRAEAMQGLLNRELSHRMKNMLAVVQAIVRQTLRNAPDIPAAQAALSDRLVAMGSAHDLLLTGNLEGASLESIIRGALAIHDDKQLGRLRLTGPPVRVGSGPALSLTLMIHELATNAGKYGALSSPEGFIEVDWKKLTQPEGDRLELLWAERGGPPIATPQRRGFGAVLIERGLASVIGANVDLSFPNTGVICTVSAPLAALTSDIGRPRIGIGAKIPPVPARAC